MAEVKRAVPAMRSYIEKVIGTEGPIPFSRYMRLCLYGEPGSPAGFYTRDREQFGKSGDFYTSSDVHAVYGRLCARQFEQMWRVMGSPTRVAIVELGPGRGLFAEDFLTWTAKKYPEFSGASQYVLVETSASLRSRLENRFVNRETVRIVSSLQEAFDGISDHVILFGNEFFDALPTEVLDHRGQVFVALDDGQLVEEFRSASPQIMGYVKKYAVQPEEGERVDVPLIAQEYMAQIGSMMQGKTGYCAFVDYGYVQEEMFAGRHMGTVKALRRHTISDSLYESPGEQDLTVHVNFTALAGSAREHYLEPLAWVSQSQFLIGIGEESQFAEAFDGCTLPQEHAKRALQLKHLITPEGMGESFHVLVISTGLEKETASRLDGLKFLRESNRI